MLSFAICPAIALVFALSDLNVRSYLRNGSAAALAIGIAKGLYFTSGSDPNQELSDSRLFLLAFGLGLAPSLLGLIIGDYVRRWLSGEIE